jgi:protein kinase-like protein/PEGA domain-containing protein
MKCFRCAAEVPDTSRFCGTCGAQLSDPQSATLVVPPEEDENQLLDRLRRVFTGEYEIEGEVGRGGMGIVLKATELGLNRTVALKILPPELGITAQAAERFKREACLVAELDHPNITPVYRAGQVGGVLHIAMRFVEGLTVDAIAEKQGPLPVPVVLAILRAATRALAYAHERDIVHRDVKGANILVDRDGRVMVSDFGVALRASDVSLTAKGTLVGTPAYMSPEQCAGRRALPQSDQYSVGVVAFQLLAGVVPFTSETLPGLIQHHLFTAPPDLRHARDDVPEGLLAIIERTLRKDPAARFGTTREMLVAVEALPFAEADRHASEEALRSLARQAPVPRVEARALPDLPATPTLLVAPVLPKRARPRSRRAVAASVAAVGLTAALIAILAWPAGAPAVPETAGSTTQGGTASAPDSAAPRPERFAAPVRDATPTGKLRVLTAPPNAEILVDGRRIGVGSLFDEPIPAGSRRIQVQAQGYQSFDTTIVVEAGATHSLGRVALPERGPSE